MKDKQGLITGVFAYAEGATLKIEEWYGVLGKKNIDGLINLGWLTEVKEPLLVTHDDLEIYDKNYRVWGLDKEYSKIDHSAICASKMENIIWFSTEAARNIFVSESENRYSEKDVSGLIDKIIFNLSALEDKKNVNIIAEVQTIYQDFINNIPDKKPNSLSDTDC